ncbi:MAG: T9SS C-terminal target domain-containing protein, partial [Calditrichaeota bacterium]
FLLHGVDNDGGYSPVPSTVLRETLAHLNSTQADYWVDSFGNVARYIKERDAVSITETAATDSSITVQITDTLPDAIFNVPLSMRRILPSGWGAATAWQNDNLVETEMVHVGADTYVQFSAIPDQGPIVILKSSGTHVQDKDVYTAESPFLWQNYPNPFNPTTTIRFNLAKAGHVTVKIIDALGKEVRVLLDDEQTEGEHSLQFHADGLESGVYFCCLSEGHFHQYLKMVLLQ